MQSNIQNNRKTKIRHSKYDKMKYLAQENLTRILHFLKKIIDDMICNKGPILRLISLLSIQMPYTSSIDQKFFNLWVMTRGDKSHNFLGSAKAHEADNREKTTLIRGHLRSHKVIFSFLGRKI